MKTINIRRSIRTFTDKKVEQEKIEKLLRAAMQAPSACNQQPWEFVVVQNEETKKELSNVGPSARMANEAPLVLALLSRKENLKRESMVDQDMGACTQNILLEVVEQGLGAVWIGIKTVPERMEHVTKTLELADNVEPFALIAIGYSEDENRFVDRYDEERVRYL